MTLRSQIKDLREEAWLALADTKQLDYVRGRFHAFTEVLDRISRFDPNDEDETGFAIHSGAEAADSLIEEKRV